MRDRIETWVSQVATTAGQSVMEETAPERRRKRALKICCVMLSVDWHTHMRKLPKVENEPLERSRWNNLQSSHRAGNSSHSHSQGLKKKKKKKKPL